MTKKNSIISGFLVLPFLLLLGSQSCLKSKRPGIPPKVIEVLNMSGIHKPKLNRFILESMQTNDSLKMQSAYFIIENLHRNYIAYYKLVDSLGNFYNLHPKDFKNLKSLRIFMDSIENSNGKLIYSADSFSIDYSSVSSNFLMNNLNKAFQTRSNNYLSLDYDFNTFLKYVLPFRVENEHIENFREILSNKFKPTIDKNKSFESNVINLNNQINKLVTYDERYIKSYSVQAINDLLENGKGNLADINVLKVKVFRSLGIAACMDYSPFIADSSGLYSWTTVITPNGKEIHLDITNGKLNYLLKNSINKIYRHTYFEDTTSLFAIKNTKENTPPFLGHFNNFDITSKYLPTTDVLITKIDSNKYFYLAVFNDGKWKPVAWAMNNNGKANFKNIGLNGLYLPVVWEEDKIRSIGNPFIINGNSKIEFLKQDKYEKTTLKYLSPEEKINPQKFNQLYYWDNEWKSIDSKINKDGSLKALVPKNTIFLISNGDRLYDERIFIIKEGKQIFY